MTGEVVMYQVLILGHAERLFEHRGRAAIEHLEILWVINDARRVAVAPIDALVACRGELGHLDSRFAAAAARRRSHACVCGSTNRYKPGCQTRRGRAWHV